MTKSTKYQRDTNFDQLSILGRTGLEYYQRYPHGNNDVISVQKIASSEDTGRQWSNYMRMV